MTMTRAAIRNVPARPAACDVWLAISPKVCENPRFSSVLLWLCFWITALALLFVAYAKTARRPPLKGGIARNRRHAAIHSLTNARRELWFIGTLDSGPAKTRELFGQS